MKKKCFALVALVLVLATLFSGCGLIVLPQKFSKMKYTRPDMAAMEAKLTAVEEILPTAKSAKQIMNKFYAFYIDYQSFVTNYSLAYIHYCQDMTDIYWETEYNYCLEQTTWLDATYDQLLYKIADCAFAEELESDNYFGAGFFDDYEGDSLWDDTLIALFEEETALLSEYYSLSAEPCDGTDAYFETTGLKIAEVYVEMVALRQEIAEYAGYSDYPAFAYDFQHKRDYTPTQAQAYMDDIADTLVPLYQQVSNTDYWTDALVATSPEQTLEHLSKLAGNIGGAVQAAYETMVRYELYDITPSEKKYDASFEMYLYSYGLPFLFVNSTCTAQDKLTLAHEFGHFCRDYYTYGNPLTLDVAEFFSQGLENLSIFYTDMPKELAQLRLYESLNVYVEQAAYASFEQRVYGLTGDDLTVENVDALFESTLAEFGMDIWGANTRYYVQIPHIFISPMYIVSYIVSNDAALQLYQMEAANKGNGLNAYMNCLGTSQTFFMAFIQEAELESPFEPGRLETVKKTFEEVLLAE